MTSFNVRMALGRRLSWELSFGSPNNPDGIVIFIGRALVHLEFAESIQEKFGPLALLKCRRGDLSDQDDIGQDNFLDRFYPVDEAGHFFEVVFHTDPILNFSNSRKTKNLTMTFAS